MYAFDSNQRHYEAKVARIEWNGKEALLYTAIDRTEEIGLQIQLKDILNAIPGGVGMFECRPEGFKVIYASDGLAKLSGLSLEEYIKGIDSGNIQIHPSDIEEVFSAITQAMENDTEVNINYRYLHADGLYYWCNLRGHRMGEQNGYPVLNALFQNLDAGSDVYQTVLDATESILIITDIDRYEILYANEAAKKAAKAFGGKADSKVCYE